MILRRQQKLGVKGACSIAGFGAAPHDKRKGKKLCGEGKEKGSKEKMWKWVVTWVLVITLALSGYSMAENYMYLVKVYQSYVVMLMSVKLLLENYHEKLKGMESNSEPGDKFVTDWGVEFVWTEKSAEELQGEIVKVEQLLFMLKYEEE